MRPTQSLIRREITKIFYVYIWHRFTSSSFSILKIGEALVRIVWALIPFSVVLFSKNHYKWYLLAGWIAIALIVRWKDLSPKNIEFNREGYAERKAKLSLALMLLDEKLEGGKNLSVGDKERIQIMALDLIVSYVRGHRSDLRNTKIYANLLMENGNDLVVANRDSHCLLRQHNSRHPKATMLAWRAMEEHRVQLSGDIQYDFPSTPGGKSYQSVLCIPIFHGDKPNPKAVGVVSIDSSEPYHFDNHENDLETNLMPYIRLLAITLT